MSFAAFASIALPAAAAAPTSASPPPPSPYATFVTGATVQSGLIPIITKAGNVYLALSKAQLGADFIETSVPASGLGGFGPAQGEPYVAPARILHFDRAGDKIVLRWPNTYARVQPSTPQAAGAAESLPSSVIAVMPIVAEDAATGTVVISASAFLGDVADLQASFDQEITNPLHGYHLDSTRAFFEATKAFPQNDVLRVSQTWASANPDKIDNAPDARSIEVQMSYNLIAAPHDGYMPRIDDPRVGYFSQPLLDFSEDRHPTRNLYYISRWNFAPARPGIASKASNPIVFYLSNDIPTEYRNTVRNALLTWNAAFARVGILNAIEVEQQPNDPNWDLEDIRHNVVRWIDTSSPQYGAEALIVTDPRTGEELNVGINVDAVEGLGRRIYRYVVAPARGISDNAAAEEQFEQGLLRSTVLHESGHDLGLQHNFIGSMAYTARELQSRAFTARYGVATSVMEYAPVNLWPKGMGQGDYFQLVLGPYDYHAVQYGYEYVPGASTPEQELPVLRRVASMWSNPTYRFASDEDVQFANGHAIDPRVQQDDLTNDPLGWCGTQESMMHRLMNAVNRRFPASGEAYDDARRAFLVPMAYYIRCSVMTAHAIGGEYLSRAAAGDPHSTAPLTPVSRADEERAWHLLGSGLFSDRAWAFNPSVLDRLTYSEVSGFTGGDWAYNPTPRHDVAVSQIAAATQDAVLNELFAPLTLQRIDDLSLKYRAGSTMSLVDLFDWARASIFGDIASGAVAGDGVVRRDLQIRYAKRLAALWTAPARGTPTDAQSLARLQLVELETDATAAGSRRGLGEMTQAHLGALAAIARQALEARPTIAGT
ncbi:MAG TPA: zinc-dependent metalloprotease [Candidatus Tyrphobacter sp.]